MRLSRPAGGNRQEGDAWEVMQGEVGGRLCAGFPGGIAKRKTAFYQGEL